MLAEEIYSLLFSDLIFSSPILSGNMQENIKTADEMTIIIDAPFYDLKKWKKDKVIVHTGEVKNGVSAYAYDVNLRGGFGTHNKSEGWVNRAILEAVNTIAGKYGNVEVINEL
jgi:hypothetical protein